MRKLFGSFCVVLVSIFLPQASAQQSTQIEINGEIASVFFNDGDTFRILSGKLMGKRSRVEGFNTLESYGPVHRWGSFKSRELMNIANEGTLNARRGGWHCTTDLSTDTYGRLLSTCMDLASDQIEKGLAHVMTVTQSPGNAGLIEKQRGAIKEGKGMWALGVPNFVLTSTHSLHEVRDRTETYDRFVSTRDGHSVVAKHRNNYEDCQEICYSPGLENQDPDPSVNSCMIYVNAQNRFGPTRAACLN